MKQNTEDSLQQPGYYWLAYEWKNLLLTCENCNDQGHKGNLFPLADSTTQATNHRSLLADEKPLLINPAELDPQRFLSFRQEFAFPVDGSLEGETTITVFGLNSDDELVEVRRKHLRRLESLLNTARLQTKLEHFLATTEATHPHFNAIQELLIKSQQASQEIHYFVSDRAEYAGMARAYIDSNPL